MNDDEAIARLRDADPARGHSTDLESLRRAVAQRTEVAPQSSSASGTDPIDEVARRRAARNRRMPWLAAAAASLVVGVVAYSIGANNDSMAPTSGSAADQASAAPAAGEANEMAEADTTDSTEQAGPEAVEQSAPQDRLSGPQTFTAVGLSDAPDTAAAFRYDPTGTTGAEAVAAIARRLDIAGPAVQGTDAQGTDLWSVTDSRGRSVEVYDDGAATVTYSSGALFACADAGGEVSDPDAGDLPACDLDGPMDPVGQTADFLTAVGLDVADFDLTETFSGAAGTSVEARATGTDPASSPLWSVQVADAGVVYASGPSAPLVAIGDYDVISPVAAVQRLMDPRFAQGVFEFSFSQGIAAAPLTAAGPSLVTIDPGTPIPWPVTAREITSATLSAQRYDLPGGVAMLLPTWLLSDDAGNQWRVLAVAESELDFSQP